MRDRERRDRMRRDRMRREDYMEIPQRGRCEKNFFKEEQLSYGLRPEDYILTFGKVFNEFR